MIHDPATRDRHRAAMSGSGRRVAERRGDMMTSITVSCAYEEGRQACIDGLAISECPYPADDPAHDAWMDGWEAAHDKVEAEEAQEVLG
jgi:ribosome modulation factor